jgi:hypothetical protein
MTGFTSISTLSSWRYFYVSLHSTLLEPQKISYYDKFLFWPSSVIDPFYCMWLTLIVAGIWREVTPTLPFPSPFPYPVSLLLWVPRAAHKVLHSPGNNCLWDIVVKWKRRCIFLVYSITIFYILYKNNQEIMCVYKNSVPSQWRLCSY